MTLVEDIEEILRKHLLWRTGQPGGERAILRDALLSRTDFSDRNLSGAILENSLLVEVNFVRANLIDTELPGASLVEANLSLARLTEADLRGASLISANLQWANLQFAKLDDYTDITDATICYAIGDGTYIKNLHPDTPESWWLTYTATHMAIGCHLHSLDDWWHMSDAEIREMAPGALRLWKKNKGPIFNALAAFPAKACCK